MSKPCAQIIDGDKISQTILADLKSKISQLPTKPGLAVILIGNDPASKRYVEKKKKACRQVGITFHEYLGGIENFFPNITQAEIIKMINWLNQDPEINAVIIQLPLPDKFDTQTIINQLSPAKDVDGFHPQNQYNADFNSPLIKAIDLALKTTDENFEGKRAVIVSKNPIFSDPLKKSLAKHGLKADAVKPDNQLAKITAQADVLISVVGQPGLITPAMIKSGATVIDVGTTLVGKNKWLGDTDPEVKNKAGWLTPVPGGIGPLTVAMLLENTYQLSQQQKYG
ncbi:MAG: bifunctional 5,10-methylenetetrahydrofolate dehydrogenase/5,10-methenyltetrahydrofolate cyclohydrolase [Patescibacteria group bacterium]|jgi:methylenetetrahydrofolate dehydrogenase (NADP+)/methenyltetrahydrofolate cyclohydrolase|nr:bifunctional 5,10-methylenetetrahydrofolate dehydrogenase/5,10-methenyltetrahydrofolate cyclohydrolase [Patescibacteria group bacterium]